MTNTLKNILLKDIYNVKVKFNNPFVSVREIGDSVIINIDSFQLNESEEYQKYIYELKKNYHMKCYFYIIWGIDCSLTEDNLDFLF